jgi:probable blue pigment (indigoidine) exporter
VRDTLVGLGVTTIVGILAVYVSTVRIGPFRTALFMDLEPLAYCHRQRDLPGRSAQRPAGARRAIMLAVLVAFQMRR